MLSWINHRMQVLDEIMRHDGLREYTSPPVCSHCLDDPGVHRCLDCSAISSYCATCITSRHKELPLHRIEVCQSVHNFFFSLMSAQVWSDGFYQRTTLLELGCSFYIGHQHTPCPSPKSIFKQILVVDTNGVHYINVQFCACTKHPDWVKNYRQLLRIKWYPASFCRPKTVFTFDLLDTYHKVMLQGKLGLLDFYIAIMQKSDNCGRRKAVVSNQHLSLAIPDLASSQERYHEISRCVRQWRHLKLIKRGGGGHSPSNLTCVPAGAFALECPACPHPGRNLPADWDKAPDGMKYALPCVRIHPS